MAWLTFRQLTGVPEARRTFAPSRVTAAVDTIGASMIATPESGRGSRPEDRQRGTDDEPAADSAATNRPKSLKSPRPEKTPRTTNVRAYVTTDPSKHHNKAALPAKSSR
jgi:hypothetical protein